MADQSNGPQENPIQDNPDFVPPKLADASGDDAIIARYQNALSLAFYEGQIAWQINVLFVGLNIGLGTIIQGKLEHLLCFDGVLLYMSAAGVVINLYWWGTFSRNNRYYHFRVAQARQAEPHDWRLVRDRGFDFSQGKSIKIELVPGSSNKRHDFHKLSEFEKRASNKWAIQISIWIFALTFLILLGFQLFTICKLLFVWLLKL
jgi:hypothetical protein